MKKRYILLLMVTVLIALGGCAKGGMSFSESDDIEPSSQKAYDLWSSYTGILTAGNLIEIRYYDEYGNQDPTTMLRNCKYNYDALSQEEKEVFDENYPDIENYYTFYDGEYYNDIYTKLIFESGGLINELDNLSDDVYNWTRLDEYQIQDGKIYGELNTQTVFDNGEVYRFEGELAVNEIPFDQTPEWLERHKKYVDSEMKKVGVENVDSDQIIEDYSAYLEEWKTASWTGDGHRVLLYKIKDYKDGTLIMEDCYRSVPSLSDYLRNKYSES